VQYYINSGLDCLTATHPCQSCPLSAQGTMLFCHGQRREHRPEEFWTSCK